MQNQHRKRGADFCIGCHLDRAEATRDLNTTNILRCLPCGRYDNTCNLLFCQHCVDFLDQCRELVLFEQACEHHNPAVAVNEHIARDARIA